MASLQEYLKRYTGDEQKNKKKKKKKSKALHGGALTIVDADPVWQKEIKEESSASEAEQEDAPLVIEDVEFKRIQRLEALRMRPYLATADDGSGWVSLNDNENQGSPEKCTPLQDLMAQDGMDAGLQSSSRKETDMSSERQETDLSPPRKHRHDSPELSPPKRDLSPPRRDSRRSHEDSPKSKPQSQDLSPPRRRRHDSAELSPEKQDFSPPRRDSRRVSESFLKSLPPSQDLSPQRTDLKRARHASPQLFPPSRDLSPPRRLPRRGRHDSPESTLLNGDLSPPRRESKRGRHDFPETDLMGPGNGMDLSSSRRNSRSARMSDLRDAPSNRGGDLSPPRRHSRGGRHDSPEETIKSLDLSPPRREESLSGKGDTHLSPARFKIQEGVSFRDVSRNKRGEDMGDGIAAGLQSGRELAKEINLKKTTESKRVKELDMSISGRNANTVYRNKHGKRLEGVDEILKLQQGEQPQKEDKPLEWGKGLVQKRQAEAQRAELEDESLKPFARTREDLDAILKDQIRWGDPMAHLVKKKVAEPVLVDLGASQQMQESGFIIPQEIPAHSWLKRGIAPPPNRYGIKPGRHWDGVDRSTGFERDMYKRQNEKKAEQVEAYLWSVADM